MLNATLNVLIAFNIGRNTASFHTHSPMLIYPVNALGRILDRWHRRFDLNIDINTRKT